MTIYTQSNLFEVETEFHIRFS